ncbi:MAG: Ribose-phosphate pyrophosphokinase [Chlamydiae bacterium]|nr:Ribose-phosphate pyrophosphokinase [Chlamydiota bacterium]
MFGRVCLILCVFVSGMLYAQSDFLLFSGTSHPTFASEVADHLGVELGKANISSFPDGENYVQILENVRGKHVFVIESVARKPNVYLMELLIMIDALKRASAKSITAVIPYYGYARQDRKDKPRVPITAKLVADLLQSAGATRVVTMDLHADQIQGFFDIPADHLYGRPALVEAIKNLGLRNSVIVAPDLGASKQARAYAKNLNIDFALIDKRRVSAEKVEVYAIIGDVKNRDVIIVDDVCSTAGTLVTAANACKKAGAKRIFVAVTHGLFVGKAQENLANSPIEKIFVSNTIPLPEELSSEKIVQVSVAQVFGEAIRSIVEKKSISSLFH